ncbi:MAG: DinB family protein [Dehalococcoidia bacterium]|nr:DinB family protein [Dehalococcoidia bacterium]
MGDLMKPTKEQIHTFYTAALDRCRDAFAKLDDKEWAKKVSEHWTAREHLAHLVIVQVEEALPLTRQAIAGERGQIPGFEKREDILDFFRMTLDRVREVPVPELLKRLDATFGEHIQMLDALSEADLDRPATSPGWDRPGTIRDLFFASYLFLPGQYQEIRKAAKKKLPHWIEASTPEQVNYHLDRLFNYMPLIFRSDRGADMQATYLFTMEGAGGGQWAIRIAEGKAESTDPAPDGFDMELKTKPELWIDLSTGELNPAWAIMTRKVHLGGNAGLAMKLGTLFSVAE